MQSRKSRSVLVVEDCPSDQDLMVLSLTRSGLHVTAVSSGPKALETLKTQQFNLIFIDLRLPGMDGVSLLPMVMEDAPNALIAIVSGHLDEENLWKVAEAGQGRCLVFEKPYLTKDNLNVLAILNFMERSELVAPPRVRNRPAGLCLSVGMVTLGVSEMPGILPEHQYWMKLAGYLLSALGGGLLGVRKIASLPVKSNSEPDQRNIA